MIIFNDSKCFQKNKAWDLQEIMDRYPNTEVERIEIGIVRVRTNQGHELQKGISLNVNNKELFKIKAKEIINELTYE